MKRKIKKLLIFTIILTLSIGTIGCANKTDGTSNYPEKSINLIVPYSAGGGTDITARAIAESAKDNLGQPIVVVNKTGAGGAVGMGEGANAAADGYTLTTITVELSTLPPQNLATFTSEDFIPILQFNAEPAAVTVRADAPWNTLEEFVEYSKANKGKVMIGNSGIGAIWHLAAAAFEKNVGTEFNHIPYEGAQPAVTALLGGHIDAVTVSPAEVAAQIKAGELKMLGVMDHNKSAQFPEVPTLKEVGYDVQVGTWRGIAVPKNTPDAIVSNLREAFKKAAESDEFKDFMEKQGATIEILEGNDYKARIDADNALFKDLIETLGLKK